MRLDEAFGAKFVKVGGRVWSFTVDLEGARTEVRMGENGEGAYFAKTLVSSATPLPGFEASPFLLGRLGSKLANLFGREVLTGDAQFDDAIKLAGDELEIGAVLDAHNRSCMRQIVHGLSEPDPWVTELRNRRVEIGRVGLYQLDIARFRARVGKIASLVTELSRACVRMDLTARLEANAMDDLEPGVRLRNIVLLLKHYPKDPRSLTVLRHASVDSDSRVREFAAKHLPSAGRSPYRT
jgi:hypothetical protein